MFQPTDVEPDHLVSIAAWSKDSKAKNILEPIKLDVMSLPWPVERAIAVININLVHIAPWEVCESLFKGVESVLEEEEGRLVMYGPFLEGDRSVKSNLAFSEKLRSTDPRWGVRELDEVVSAARSCRLCLLETVRMPANNLSLIFKLERKTN